MSNVSNNHCEELLLFYYFLLDNWPTSSSALADLEMDQFSQVIVDPIYIACSIGKIYLEIQFVYTWLTVFGGLRATVLHYKKVTILWFSTTGRHLQSFSHNKIYEG